MAVIKTVFTGTTTEQRAAEMLAYLQANASGFFDSITADETGNISCIIDGITALYLPYPTGNYTFTIKNGNTFSDVGSGVIPFKVGYHSTYGILLQSNDRTCAVAKNELGHTVLVGIFKTTSASSSFGYRFADFTDGASITTPWKYNNSATEAKTVCARPADLTAIVPCVFSGGHYSEGLCITPFSEYAGSAGILDLNGVQYGYDGALALRG